MYVFMIYMYVYMYTQTLEKGKVKKHRSNSKAATIAASVYTCSIYITSLRVSVYTILQ